MNYIGIDVHKSICTAVVMNDDDKVIDQIIDFGTNDEGFSFITEHYSPEDSYILFENLTTAHRVYHFFNDRGYRVEGLNTGNGCVTEISNTDFKTDIVMQALTAGLTKWDFGIVHGRFSDIPVPNADPNPIPFSGSFIL